MFCVNCGKPYDPQHKFCNHCGQPVPSVTVEPVRSQTPASPPTEETPLAPNVVAENEIIAQATAPTMPRPGSAKGQTGELRGLGGWLSLVGFGLCVSPLLWSYTIFQDVKLFNDGTVQFLSDPSSSVYIANYSDLLKFELIGNIVLLAANICLLNLFFRERRSFPRYYVVLLIGIPVFTAVDNALTSAAFAGVSADLSKTLGESVSGQGTRVIQAFVAAIVWGLYMQKSKRVKATFVR
jgi:hypothetical protein